MTYSSINKDELSALLESSMSDFQNNNLQKILKKVDKLSDEYSKYNGVDISLSLTESILFPKDIRRELVSPVRQNLNEFLYSHFTYQNLFDRINAEPYNLSTYYYLTIENIFIDTYVDVFSIHSELYKNIALSLEKRDLNDFILKSQGVTLNFNSLDDISTFSIYAEDILQEAYNKTISTILKNRAVVSIRFTSIYDKDNYLNQTISYYDKKYIDMEVEGMYSHLDIPKNIDFNEFVRKVDQEIKKNKEHLVFHKKDKNSVIYIPKNKNANLVFDHGYFNQEKFRKLIERSRQNPIGHQGERKEDYDYLVQNFKVI